MHLFFAAPPEAPTTRGFASILHGGLDGLPAADVLDCTTSPGLEDASRVNLFGKGFQFLRADRITPAVTYPKSQHAVVHERFLGPQGAYTPHYLLKYGVDAPDAEAGEAAQRSGAARLLARVNEFMQAFSPGVMI